MALTESQVNKLFEVLERVENTADQNAFQKKKAISDVFDEKTIKEKIIHTQTKENLLQYAVRTDRYEEAFWLIQLGLPVDNKTVHPYTKEDFLQYAINNKRYEGVFK